jgi:arylsulfatase A-like enzyme
MFFDFHAPANKETDNGYHIGQHRLQPGKLCGYEEDANVPMIIRVPEIREGAATELVTSHTDLGPTILSLIGAQQRPDFDGIPIPVKADELFCENKDWQEHVAWNIGALL